MKIDIAGKGHGRTGQTGTANNAYDSRHKAVKVTPSTALNLVLKQNTQISSKLT